MANDAVEGKKMLLLLDSTNTPDAPYDMVVCLTSSSFTRAANVIDASTYCGTKKVNGTKDRTIEIDGEIEVNSEAGRISEFDLNTIFENDTKVRWLFGPQDPLPGEYYYEGSDAVISNVSLSGQTEGNATFSATLQLSGTPVGTIHSASS